MSFSGERFLRVAKELFENAGGSHPLSPQSEVHLRSSVGRAYYAVFWAAREYAETHGAIGKLSHEALAEYFINSTAPDLSKFGKDLRAAHVVRVWADYRADPKIERDDAQALLEEAKRLIDELRSFP